MILIKAGLVLSALAFVFQTCDAASIQRSKNEGVIDPQPPLISLGPRSQSLGNGDTLELTCEAHGSPGPLIFWTHNGRHIGSESMRQRLAAEQLLNGHKPTVQFGETGSRLIIPSFSGHKHKGTYVCHAESSSGTVSKHANVELNDSSAIVESWSEETGLTASSNPANLPANDELEPQVFVWSIRRLELDTRAAQLPCRGEQAGRQLSTVWKWQEDDEADWQELIQADEGIKILPNGDLLIEKSSPLPFSFLASCQFVNDAGEFIEGNVTHPAFVYRLAE